MSYAVYQRRKELEVLCSRAAHPHDRIDPAQIQKARENLAAAILADRLRVSC